jgi:hypothetical protein
LGKYIRETFGQDLPPAEEKGRTTILERPSQASARMG